MTCIRSFWFALAALLVVTASAIATPRPFTARDLVSLSRVSDPQVSPDGRMVVYTQRDTDLDANRALRSLWLLSLAEKGATPKRLSAPGSNASAARWSADGRALYFISDRGGSDQIWNLTLGMGEARDVTHLPLPVTSFELAPDGHHVALSIDVYVDCPDLSCTKKRDTAKESRKSTGAVYDQMFVRHWDTWLDGHRSQLYVATIDADGAVGAEPTLVSSGIDGDVPSKPFGDASEYRFSPDSRTIYFGARIAGRTEPWSTNFDVYAAPIDGSVAPRNLTGANLAWDAYPRPSADGTKLYYLAMKAPKHEADRFAIMELILATGQSREVDPAWDRSAGAPELSADGRTLYTTADDVGERPLFAIDVATGRAKRVVAGGSISDFSVRSDTIVVARDALNAPAELYRIDAKGSAERLTAVNATRLQNVAFSEFQVFRFKGWNDEQVQGYVMKPYGYVAGHKYPVAFLIHGGPQGSWLNDFHYRWNPQTYAGLGFAVVVVDFHGSTGYGQAFTNAISTHWGDRPLEDLQKGWAAALEQFPYLAGDNACALGASYGGYMVNWIAGNWVAPASGPWKCLVNHDGVFDSRMMYFSTEELWFEEVENGSTPWEDPRAYEQFNPATRVGQWHTPMLVVQGGKDMRIPLEQGLGTFTALQRRGIPSELLYFADENHWVLKPQNSLQWHDTVAAWLKRWTHP